MLLDPETLALAPGVERLLPVRRAEDRALLLSDRDEYAYLRERLRGTRRARAAPAPRRRARGGRGPRRRGGRLPSLLDPGGAADRRRAAVPEDGRRARADREGQLVCGLHVHVGMETFDACLRTLAGIRPWLGDLLLLSANSPYLAGDETGALSSRLGAAAPAASRRPAAAAADRGGLGGGGRRGRRRLHADLVGRPAASAARDARGPDRRPGDVGRPRRRARRARAGALRGAARAGGGRRAALASPTHLLDASSRQRASSARGSSSRRCASPSRRCGSSRSGVRRARGGRRRSRETVSAHEGPPLRALSAPARRRAAGPPERARRPRRARDRRRRRGRPRRPRGRARRPGPGGRAGGRADPGRPALGPGRLVRRPGSERRAPARARAACPRGAGADRAPARPTSLVLFRETSVAGTFAGLGGVEGLGRWVTLRSGRLPRTCRRERCEVLRLRGEGRMPAARRNRGSSRSARRCSTSRVLFGDFLAPTDNALAEAEVSPLLARAAGYHRPPPPPLFLAEGVDALAGAPALGRVYRSYAWVAPLARGARGSGRSTTSPRRSTRGPLGAPGGHDELRSRRAGRGAARGAGDEPRGGATARRRRRRGCGAPVRIRAPRCDDAPPRPARRPPPARLVRRARLAARARDGGRVGRSRARRDRARPRGRAGRRRLRRGAGRRARRRRAHAQRRSRARARARASRRCCARRPCSSAP